MIKIYYDNIKRICADKDISIHKLEMDIGIGNGTIGKWKTRQSIPNLKTLAVISEYLGVDIAELISKEN